jgi:zinc protease
LFKINLIFRAPFIRHGSPIAAFLLISVSFALAQPAAVPVHFTLRNGLEVIFGGDSALPSVSVAIAYRVGSADDPPGKSGLAYLMETLMFSGSANVPPLQHINTMYRIGGNFNASVTEDRTVFFQTVPSHYLALVLWLESDRMRSLDITPEALQMARDDHVSELRRKRLEEPYLESRMVFDQMIFPDPAYNHPLAGTEATLGNLKIEDARSFYADNYVPNRAVLSISGKFDRARARELVARYFETIPRGKDVPRTTPPPTVPLRKEPARNMEDAVATTPAFHCGFRLGPAASADMVPLGLIEYILLKGPSSRLTRRLLNKSNKIAYQAGGGIDTRGGNAVFRLFVIVNTESMLPVCQNAIAAEFDRLRRSFVPEDELIRAKNAFKADHFDLFSTPTAEAFNLAEAFLSLPDFADLPKELERAMKVTPYEIRVAANRYFSAEDMCLVNARTK